MTLSDIAFTNFMRRMERMSPDDLLRETTYGPVKPRPDRTGTTPGRNQNERDHYHRDRQPNCRP